MTRRGDSARTGAQNAALPNGWARSLLTAALPATAVLLAACSDGASDAADTAATPSDTSTPPIDAPDGVEPPVPARYTLTFRRGVPDTLWVADDASPLYGFRLTLEGDELAQDELTVTVYADGAADGAATPTVVLEPHGAVFVKPVAVTLPFAEPPLPSGNAAERLVVVQRTPAPGAPPEVVTDTLAMTHHTVSGWFLAGPLALRGGPTPVGWVPEGLVANGPTAWTRPYPWLVTLRTLGFSSLSGRYAARNDVVSADAIHRGLACSADADCNDGMACSTDRCVAFDGGAECTWTWALPGTPCDDGDASTVGDACRKYLCSGVDRECTRASDCEDGSPCTVERCDAGVCAADPAAGEVACWLPAGPEGRCVDGACVERDCTADADCDDGEPCTVDRCTAGACVREAAPPGPCDDGNPATDGDACTLGRCAGVVTICGASVTTCPGTGGCAVATCSALGGGHYCASGAVAEGTPCDDGDPDTAESTCVAGWCRAPVTECTCADATLTPAPCDWGDATECTGWASAYCYDACGGWGDTDCLVDCDGQVPGRSFTDGETHTAEGCTLTLHCR